MTQFDHLGEDRFGIGDAPTCSLEFLGGCPLHGDWCRFVFGQLGQRRAETGWKPINPRARLSDLRAKRLFENSLLHIDTGQNVMQRREWDRIKPFCINATEMLYRDIIKRERGCFRLGGCKQIALDPHPFTFLFNGLCGRRRSVARPLVVGCRRHKMVPPQLAMNLNVEFMIAHGR